MDSERKQQLIEKLKRAKEEAAARRQKEHVARQLQKSQRRREKFQSQPQKDVKYTRGKIKASATAAKHDLEQDVEPPCKAAKDVSGVRMDKEQDVEVKRRKTACHQAKQQKETKTPQSDHNQNVHGRQKQQGCDPKQMSTTHRDQKKKWKFYSQRYRDKLKDDPVLAERTKEKEHARYLRRKQLKKIKLVSDISDREKRKRRKKWRENTKRYRERQAPAEASERYVNENSPKETPTTSILPSGSENSSAQQHRLGRRKVRRDRAAAYVRLEQLEIKLEAAKRQAERCKKRLQRMQQNTSVSPSPRKKVNQLLRGRKVANDIRKRLVYSACVDKQLKFNAAAATSQRQKQIFTRAVSGSILKKYGMLSRAKGYCPWQLLPMGGKK